MAVVCGAQSFGPERVVGPPLEVRLLTMTGWSTDLVGAFNGVHLYGHPSSLADTIGPPDRGGQSAT